MLNKELTIYKSLNLHKSTIPPRSCLYSLDPIGVGTPYSESLTSYTTRLADVHCVPTGLLITTEISSCYQEEFLSDSNKKNLRNLIGSSEHHRALNGTGIIANRLIEILEKLTLRTDLCFLTMVTWSEVISAQGLFRPSKAWCPICYDEWRAAGKLIYEPLIWGLEVVKVCPVHYQHLQTLCPYCNKKLFSLEWHSRPGYCSKCQKWLGDTSKLTLSSMVSLSHEEAHWQELVITNISQLIANAPKLLYVVDKNRMKNILADWVNHVFKKKLKSFEDAIDVPHTTLYKWYSGQTLPKLCSILKICNYFEVSLFDFLSKDFDNIDFTIFRKNHELKSTKIKLCSYKKRIDLVAMKQLIDAAINEYPPPTLKDLKLRLGIESNLCFHKYFPDLTLEIIARHKQYKINDVEKRLLVFLETQYNSSNYPLPITLIASKIKVSTKTLHKYFPDLCNELTNNYLDYIKQHRIKVVNQNYNLIRQAVIDLHVRGIIPNIANLIHYFGIPQKVLNKINMSIVKEIWSELGYLELL